MKKRGVLSILVLLCALSAPALAGDTTFLPPPDFSKNVVAPVHR
ncbi:hypothetical protein [Deinococcus cellulosilyticus]|uniref:Uncharacterized protein n=1 Tax=Deinococcus cellulosilyticus (strain DSM 18568 / NBRC 106333 / KACC 11606 / 5516J-15) TaxID=1223518 RepID=A0A511NAZ6_DEIC1|nr:hypothetical protein [Deinococcus cellulosilyticus]GEM49962.1 hypothetical protein DC3_55970 [Deinococcus cellulosilyticus NBRC 106333 = KACC 11606]